MADTDLILNVIEKTTGNALRDGARDLDRTADSADNASGKFRNLGHESSHVDSEITRLRGHMRDLAQEFNRTGDSSILKNIGKDNSQIRQLERVAKMLTPIGETAGKEFNKGFLSTMGELGGNLRGALIPAAIGIGVLLSPIIGAAVAGAVTGAVGLGGIAGGIAAAAQDQQVKQAASHFAEDIGFEFAKSGKSFVQPVIESLDILEQGFRDLDLGGMFAKAAPFVTEFARGLTGLATSAMPGINRAMAQLGPAMAVMSDELPEVGSALGDMIGDMAESKGAIEGLQYVFELLEATLRVTGSTVAFLGDTFHFIANSGASFSGAMEDITAKLAYLSPVAGVMNGVFVDMNNKLEEITRTAPNLVGAFSHIEGRLRTASELTADFTASNSHAAMSVQELGDALNELFDDQINYDTAVLQVKKDTADLIGVVKAHGASLSDNTQAGLINQSMILQLIRDYEGQRDAAIKAGKGTGEATRKFDDQIDSLGGLLSKLGFNKTAIDKLLDSYRKLHSAPNIQKEIRFNVSVTGQTGALSAMGNIGKIASFDVGGMIPGPRGKPMLAMVHGGEYVNTAEEVTRAKRAGTRYPSPPGGSGGTTRVELVINTSGAPLDNLVGDLVRRYVYNRGGNVAVLAS